MTSRWISRTAHALAALISILVLTLVPIVLYGLLLLFQAIFFGGGAEAQNLILVPFLALLVAVGLTVGLFMPIGSLLARLTRNRRNAGGRASLVAFVLFFLIAVGLQILISQGTLRTSPLALQFDALVALVLFASFLVYWIPLQICLALFPKMQKLVAQTREIREKTVTTPGATIVAVEKYQPEPGVRRESDNTSLHP